MSELSPFAKEALPKARTKVDRFKLAVADLMQRNIGKRVKNGIDINSLPPLSKQQKKLLSRMLMEMSPGEQATALQEIQPQRKDDALQI